MERITKKQLWIPELLIAFCVLSLTACGRDSSPEGRMSMQLETLQQQMTDSLRKQNRDMLDSLGKIRQELEEIKARIK